MIGSPRIFDFPLKLEHVQAASTLGHSAIYRDSNGTHDTNNATYTGVPFNVQQTQDATFTQNANDIDIDLADSGRYLFGYTIQSRNDSYTNRVSYRSRVTLGGTEQVVGHGQGFRRSAVDDRYHSYGYGIINASAGEDFRVEVIRQGTNDPSTHLLEANRSSMWLLKLDDTWDYLRLQGADNQATTVTKQTINFTNLVENTNTSTFSHDTGTNPHQITLKEAGHYLITYNVGVDGSENRTSITTNLDMNGTDIPQSFDYAYIRSSDDTTEGTATNMTILEANANDILTLEWGALDNNSANGTNTMSDRTAITIVKLPDSADYLRAYEAGGGQSLNNTTTTTVIFDTQSEADSSSFSYNTTSGVTTIQQDGNYLFTHGARSVRDNTNARTMRGGFWYVNGVQQTVGNTGVYIRGDGGSQDSFAGGWSAAGLFSLSNTNTIDFRYEDQGDDGGGGTDSLQANSYGITAVNLNTLFPSGDDPTPAGNFWFGMGF